MELTATSTSNGTSSRGPQRNMISSGCSFGVLAIVPIDSASGSSSSLLSRTLKKSSSIYGVGSTATQSKEEEGNDLLLACSSEYLHVFMRKIKNLNCSCHENGPSPVLKNGFQCPHVSFYEDFWPHGAIPWTHLTQIYMTYRTTNNVRRNSSARSIATRTKDLFLEFTNENANCKQLLRLEFEHNLARGSFLDEIVRLTSSKPVDVDYIDLNERNDLKSTLNFSLYPPIPFKNIVSVTAPTPHVSGQSTTSTPRASMTVLSEQADQPLAPIGFTNTVTNVLNSTPNTPQDVVKLNFEEFVTVPPPTEVTNEATPGSEASLSAAGTNPRLSLGLSRPDVEAIAAAAAAYVHSAVEAAIGPTPVLPQSKTQDYSVSKLLTEPEARFAFIRDALRCLLIQKLKATLQIADESNAIVLAITTGKEDEQIQCLLKTCMELSSVLDEPDLFVLTLVLIASGEQFLHPQQALNKMLKALEMAQQNSFDMLNFLILQCLVELYLNQQNFHQAMQLLKQLSKQVPSQMQQASTIKMEIHKRIHTLRVQMLTQSKVSVPVATPSNSSTTTTTVSAAAKRCFDPFKCVPCISLFLFKVHKKALHRGSGSVAATSGSLYVEIQSIITNTNTSTSPPLRYRVFYDGLDTMLWLQEEITRRHAIATTNSGSGSSSSNMIQKEQEEVESFVNPSDGKVYRFSDRIMQCTLEGQLIVARMVPTASTSITATTATSTSRNSTTTTTDTSVILAEALDMMRMASSSMDGTPIPTATTVTVVSPPPPGFLTCSLCHQLIHLDQVEDHSEVCFGR